MTRRVDRPRTAARAITVALAALVSGCATDRPADSPPPAATLSAPPSPPAAAAPAPRKPATWAFSALSVAPKTFDPGSGATVAVSFETGAPSLVSLRLLDENGGLVHETEASPMPAGAGRVEWDGRVRGGDLVRPGAYLYQLVGRDAAGAEAVSDPMSADAGAEVAPREFTFDAASGEIVFRAPRACRARLRVGLRGFPHLRTLLDWEPLASGEHRLVWDGWDASGLVRLVEHPALDMNLRLFALPDRALIVTSGGDRPMAAPAPLVVEGDRSIYPDGAFLHARHRRDRCGELSVALEFPRSAESPDGCPVVEGVVPVRVSVAAADRTRAVDEQFEVMVYVDTVFLFEQEEGSTPFTFEWDASALTDGPHLLTVNVLTYGDHVGVSTRRVVKGPAAEPERASGER